MSVPQETLDRWTDGERLFATALGRLTDEGLDGPSLLPGWDRRHVLAHVARNADAVLNLLTWARTGEETPMYPSPEAREAGIAETAALDPSRLRTELVAATARFADAVRGMPEAAWSAQVRTMQGRTVPAAEVPWMRCIEVVVHAVDLDAGVSFADVDEQVQAAICDAVFGSWERRGGRLRPAARGDRLAHRAQPGRGPRGRRRPAGAAPLDLTGPPGNDLPDRVDPGRSRSTCQ